MGTGKKTEQIAENMAVLRYGRHRREVKVGQYYSIYDFCRDAGCDKETADVLSKWCRKAEAGETKEAGEITIQIKMTDNYAKELGVHI